MSLRSSVGGPSVQDQIRRLWFDMAGSSFPNQIPALVKAFGDEQLLFGSDYCWAPAAFVVRHVAWTGHSSRKARPGGR